MLRGFIYLLIISTFSNEPKLLHGINTIRPVKFVRSASIAANEVSLSPKITKVRGSMISRFRNFFLLKAGICSGTVISIYSSRTLTGKVDKFRKFGPASGNPLPIS